MAAIFIARSSFCLIEAALQPTSFKDEEHCLRLGAFQDRVTQRRA